MTLLPTDLPGVLLIEHRVFEDARGRFYVSFNDQEFRDATGVRDTFVQDNQSRSVRGVLRGMHYQIRQPQGKLVRVVQGAIRDVVVDIRRSSPTFGRWQAFDLSGDRPRSLWVPAGFAHGFVALSDTADVAYKTTDYYAPQWERSLLWNDAGVGIDWGLEAAGITEPLLSPKDVAGIPLEAAETFP